MYDHLKIACRVHYASPFSPIKDFREYAIARYKSSVRSTDTSEMARVFVELIEELTDPDVVKFLERYAQNRLKLIVAADGGSMFTAPAGKAKKA